MTKSEGHFKNLEMLLRNICLRRTRKVLGLQDPTPRIRFVEFTTTEREQYHALENKCRRNIDIVLSNGKKKLNSTILHDLLNLRLFCNQGGHASEYSNTLTDADEKFTYLQQQGDTECSICNRQVYSISDELNTEGGRIMPNCSHLICRGCLGSQELKKGKCPQCFNENGAKKSKSPKSVNLTEKSQIPATSATDREVYSSKMMALLHDIKSEKGHKR